jgi:hypothetical protein
MIGCPEPRPGCAPTAGIPGTKRRGAGTSGRAPGASPRTSRARTVASHRLNERDREDRPVSRDFREKKQPNEPRRRQSHIINWRSASTSSPYHPRLPSATSIRDFHPRLSSATSIRDFHPRLPSATSIRGYPGTELQALG